MADGKASKAGSIGLTYGLLTAMIIHCSIRKEQDGDCELEMADQCLNLNMRLPCIWISQAGICPWAKIINRNLTVEAVSAAAAIRQR